MATMEMDLKDRLADIYYQFMTDMHIGKYSGIFYGDPPVKKKKKKKKGSESEDWRFASMPYVGERYNSAQPKILFIGLDMGKDINKKRYLGFDGRHNTILGIDKNKNKNKQQQDQEQTLEPVFKYNPHIAGTYAVALAILSQCDKYKSNSKWSSEWDKLSKNQNLNKKTQTVVNKYRNKQDEDERENNVLEYVALTNLFKFVTVDRDKAQGGENRCFINRKLELKLLRDEVNLFNPDIIILQGKEISIYKKTIAGFKKKGIKVIEGCHPSYATGGWNKISGVKKLLEDNNLLPKIDN